MCRRAAAQEASSVFREGGASGVPGSQLALLDARGIEVSAEEKDKILDNGKSKQLEKWLVRAATADNCEEVFNGD